MNRIHVLAGTAALVTFAVAGCGGSKPLRTIDNAQSQVAGRTLAVSIEDSANALGPASSSPAFASSASCYTISGDVSDPDQDGIPANATVTYTGCTKTAPTYAAVFDGTENVKDTRPAQAAFAFSIDVDGTLAISAAGGASETVHRAGSILASLPAAGTYQLVHDESTTIEAQSGTQSYSASELYGLTTQYTPSGAWTPGQPAVAGTYSVDGSWNADVNGASADTSVSTTTPLSIDPACDTHVTAGTVTATFAGPNATRTLVVTWNGCGSRTVQYTETPN